MRETMSEVAQGVPRYDQILQQWNQVQPLLTDQAVGEAWEQRIRRAKEAQNVYSAYVQTFLICYAYRDTPTPALRDELVSRLSSLKKTLAAYQKEPDHFQIRAIQVFIDIADRTLVNREALERYLAGAPTPEEINQKLKAAEAHDSEMGKRCPSAKTFLSWNGAVDGRDVLILQGNKLTDDRRLGNDPHNVQMKIHQPFPKRPLTYFIDRHAGRGWTVLLQSPSAANDWTAKIYVDDPQPSEDVYRFDLKGAENCAVAPH
jgi:hypothetical protein